MMFPRQPELENALITKEVGGKEVGIEENQFDERIDEPLMQINTYKKAHREMEE